MKIVNKALETHINLGRKIKLHLGSDKISKKGFYNLDIIELEGGGDIVAEMNKPLHLIPDNSVSEIYTQHAQEHIKNLTGLMEEFYRICSPRALITITAPHFSNPYYYSGPTHVRPFGLYTINYFLKEENQLFQRKVPSFYTSTNFQLIDIKFYFYRTCLFDRIFVPIIRFIVNMNMNTTSQETYERLWTWLYPAWQIKCRLNTIK